MPSYTIYEKPGLSVEDAIDSAIMVKDHYSMLAFFVPVVWILVKRLWWVLLAYLLLSIPLFALESVLPIWSSMVMTLLISFWIAVEAPNLIGWSLKRKGFVEVASLYAEDINHCEARYIKARTADGTVLPVMGQPKSKKAFEAPRSTASIAQKDSIIGLFPAPEQSKETK